MRPEKLLARLDAVRRRIRWLLVLDGAGTTLILLLAAIGVAVVLDYLLWLPGPARLVIAVAVASGALATLWLRVGRPATARIGLGEVAGRIDARLREFDDRLASAVFLCEAPSAASPAMIEHVVRQAERDSERISAATLTRSRRSLTLAAVAALLVLLMAGIGLTAPQFVETGLARYLQPFGAVQWPRTVCIVPVSADARRPIGGWFEARARIERGWDEGLRVFLCTENPQGRRERHAMTYDARTGEYYHPLKDLRTNLTYWFEAGDDSTADRGGRFQIAVVPRPAVVLAELTLTPPSYADASQTRTLLLSDEPVQAVEGTRARLVVQTNKPLQPGPNRQDAATLERPDGSQSAMAALDESGKRFAAEFGMSRGGSMTVRLVDQFGFDNLDGQSYALVVREDEPPHVVILEPQTSLQVTPSARVRLAVSADDDYGIARLGVEVRLGMAATSQPSTLSLTDRMNVRRNGGRVVAAAEYPWNLGPMSLKPGDVVTYRAMARDNFALDGRRHPPAHSGEMQLRVVSPEELINRLREEALLLKNAVRELLGGQEAARDEVGTVEDEMDTKQGLNEAERQAVTGVAGEQNRLAGRAQYLSRRFDDLVERLTANRAKDDDLDRQGRRAAEQLRSVAGGPMREAAETLHRSTQLAAPKEQTEAMARADKAQQLAIAELRSLLAGMERWGSFQDAVRQLQQILDQQERQTDATGRLAERTLGRTPEQLDVKLKASLKQRTREQQQLAKDFDGLEQKMNRLVESIRRNDPAAAEAMAEAIRAAQDSGPPRAMRQAAEAIKQNQMARAKTSQREAENALREMLAKLQARKSESLKVLSKRLQDAVDKVQSLLADQRKLLEETEQLARDKDARQREQLARRQRGLARASSTIARDVDKLQGASGPSRDLNRAGQKMDQATGDLSQGDAEKAAQREKEAIERLEDALETLQKLRDEAEAKKANQSLSAVADEIRAIRQEQAGIHTRLGEVVDRRQKGQELTRADLRRLDKMGTEERGIQQKTSKVRARMDGAPVYAWVLEQIGVDMGRLAERMERRQADTESGRLAESILERLDYLIAGLDLEPPEDKQEQDKFAEGGGGGGQAGKVKPVPTVAELLVLKSLQADLNRRTQRADLERQMADEPTEQQLERIRTLGDEQKRIRALAERIIQGARR